MIERAWFAVVAFARLVVAWGAEAVVFICPGRLRLRQIHVYGPALVLDFVAAVVSRGTRLTSEA